MRKIALKQLVNFLEEEEEEISSCKCLFRKINSKNTGVLSAAELREAIITPFMITPTQDSINIDSYFAENENHKVNYSDFLAAMLEQKLLETNRIKRVFKHLDVDDTDYISTINLQRFLSRTGKTVTHSELISIM